MTQKLSIPSQKELISTPISYQSWQETLCKLPSQSFESVDIESDRQMPKFGLKGRGSEARDARRHYS